MRWGSRREIPASTYEPIGGGLDFRSNNTISGLRPKQSLRNKRAVTGVFSPICSASLYSMCWASYYFLVILPITIARQIVRRRDSEPTYLPT